MKNTGKLIDSFKATTDEHFGTFDLGIIKIDPERIIALNLDVDDIKDDRRMKKLKDSVKSKGWTNEGPYGFALLQFPNGDLAVNGGGNHRAYLSKELKKQGKLQYVKAHVLKVVYLERLPKEVFERLNELEIIYQSESWQDEEQWNKVLKERMEILLSI